MIFAGFRPAAFYEIMYRSISGAVRSSIITLQWPTTDLCLGLMPKEYMETGQHWRSRIESETVQSVFWLTV